MGRVDCAKLYKTTIGQPELFSNDKQSFRQVVWRYKPPGFLNFLGVKYREALTFVESWTEAGK